MRPPPSTVCDEDLLKNLNRVGATFDCLPSKPIQMKSVAKIDRDQTMAEINDRLEALDAPRIEVMMMIENRQPMETLALLC
jgi:hypothetical protein